MLQWKRAFNNLGATSLDGGVVIWRVIKAFAIRNARKFPGITASLALHFFLLILLLGGFVFDWFKPKPKIEPPVISAEILPIKEITNIKTQEAEKKVEKPKEKPKAKPKPKKAKTTSKPKPKPKLQKPKVKPKPKKPTKAKPKAKPKPKKKEKPKPKPKQKDDFESVLKNLEKTRESTKDKPKSMGTYNPTIPLSISESDAFRKQLQECWSILPGARDADKMAVTIYFTLARDGTVTSAEIVDAKNGSPFFRASAESALRAVYDCSPFQNLPVKKYDTWKENEFTFDPKEMF